MTKRFWVNVSATIEVDEEEAAYEALNNLRTMVKSVGGSVERCSVLRNSVGERSTESPTTFEQTGPAPDA